MEDVSMFLFLECQETKALNDLAAWLPVALKCGNWETGSNIYMALAICVDAVEIELAKRAKELGYID